MSADCVILPFRRLGGLPTVAEGNDLDTLAGDLEVSDAVDADEVAAVLEATGINDTVAAEKFGHPDVFALATALLPRGSVRSSRLVASVDNQSAGRQRSRDRVVHRSDKTRRTDAGGWREVPVGEVLLRGITFVVPGLTAAGFPALSAAPRDRLAVMIAVVAGWALSQGLAGRGYLRLAVDKADARRSTATAAGSIALLATGLATAAVWWLGVSPWAGAMAGAQVVYAAAATTALLFGGVRPTLLALIPAVLGAIDAGLGRPAFEAAAGFALSLILVCAVAVSRVWSAFAAFAKPAKASPGERALVLRYVGYGAALAILLVSGLTVWAPVRRVDPVVLALVVSVIAIEWEVVRLLTRGRALLRSSTHRRLLMATGWRLLGAAMLRYAVFTATLAGLALTVLPGSVTHLGWVLSTGLVFLVGGILVTHHGLTPAVRLTGPAAAAALGLVVLDPAAAAWLVTALTVALAVALTVVTGVRLGRPEAHR